MSHAAVRECSTASEIDDVFGVGRSHDTRIVDGDVHEQFVEFHVLLGVCVEQVMELQTRNGQHRRTIELRVIEAIEKMNSAGA
ncbi:MAG TPA: hypothetical protein VM620_09070 [Hyphomicrobium sp.]|nr:hypothetical protein [Hyphomicrobium sp.]